MVMHCAHFLMQSLKIPYSWWKLFLEIVSPQIWPQATLTAILGAEALFYKLKVYDLAFFEGNRLQS